MICLDSIKINILKFISFIYDKHISNIYFIQQFFLLLLLYNISEVLKIVSQERTFRCVIINLNFDFYILAGITRQLLWLEYKFLTKMIYRAEINDKKLSVCIIVITQKKWFSRDIITRFWLKSAIGTLLMVLGFCIFFR